METDSILLLGLLEKINLKFQTDVSIEEFLGHTSIRKMADFLKDESCIYTITMIQPSM